MSRSPAAALVLLLAIVGGGTALRLHTRRAALGAVIGAAAAASPPGAASASRSKPTKESREAAKEYKYAPRPIMDENYRIINADVAQGSELADFFKEKGKGFKKEFKEGKEGYQRQQEQIAAALKANAAKAK